MLTGFHESLRTFERFQRQYSQGHNSNVKVGFFIFLRWQRDIHNKCNTVSELFTFSNHSFDNEHSAWDSGLIERCTIWDPHLISCQQLSCESLLLLLIQCIFTFVTDKTAFWTNMTTTPELAKTCIFGKTALSSLGIISQHLTKSHKYTSQIVKLVQVEISKKFFSGVSLHHRRRRLFIGKLGH